MIKFDIDLKDLNAKALCQIIADCTKHLSTDNLVGVLVQVQLMIFRRMGGLPNEHN